MTRKFDPQDPSSGSIAWTDRELYTRKPCGLVITAVTPASIQYRILCRANSAGVMPRSRPDLGYGRLRPDPYKFACAVCMSEAERVQRVRLRHVGLTEADIFELTARHDEARKQERDQVQRQERLRCKVQSNRTLQEGLTGVHKGGD